MLSSWRCRAPGRGLLRGVCGIGTCCACAVPASIATATQIAQVTNLRRFISGFLRKFRFRFRIHLSRVSSIGPPLRVPEPFSAAERPDPLDYREEEGCGQAEEQHPV